MELAKESQTSAGKSHDGKPKYYYEILYRPVVNIEGRNIRYELWIGDKCEALGVLNVDLVLPSEKPI